MADVKISELPALTTPDGAEELVVNDGGTTKKITITNATSVKANIASPVFTGNVGIGNNSPASSVGSCVDATGPLLVGGHINSHQTNKSVIENNSNNMKLRAYGATSGTGYMTFNTGGGGDAADAEAMRIDSLGSVGIGTSSPTGNLDVTGTANSTVSITAAGIANDSLLNFVQGSAIEGGITYDHASGYTNEKMIFRAGNNTAHMTITGAGNLGIGTSSPASELQVEHAGGGGLTLKTSGGGNFARFTRMASGDTTNGDWSLEHSSKALVFKTNAASGSYASPSWTNAMSISNAGRVTKPYQPVATAGWTSHISAPTTLPANNILTNVGSHLAANGRFTCPIAGVYHVGVAYMSLASGNTRVHLRKNGSEYGAGTMVAYQNHSSTYGAASAQGYISCSANDYLEWYLDAGYVQLHSGHGQINFALFS